MEINVHKSLEISTAIQQLKDPDLHAQAISVLSENAAFLSDDSLKDISLAYFGKVIKEIRVFPVEGELGIFKLVCRKIQNQFDLLFSTESSPPLYELIQWKCLPPNEVTNVIQAVSQPNKIVSKLMSPEPIFSRSLSFMNTSKNFFVWKPGCLLEERTQNFQLKIVNASQLEYSASFQLRSRIFEDCVIVWLQLENMNTIAKPVLNGFRPDVEIDGIKTSLEHCVSGSRHNTFTQYDKICAIIQKSLVNLNDPTITIKIPDQLRFELLYSIQSNPVRRWGFYSFPTDKNILDLNISQ